MTKLSLATLVALGAFSYANAEVSLEEAIKGTTINGYAYGRLTSMFGDDASGSAFRSRVFADIKTGNYHGFRVGTTFYASMGSASPNGGSFLKNSEAPTGQLPVKLYSLYGEQTFESTKTTITAGKATIATPFSDGGWDYGYGARISNADVEGVTFHLQGYGAWALDNSTALPGMTTLETDRPLFIFGVSGNKAQFAGFGFETWVAHAIKTIDFLTFVDLNYTFSGVTLQTQVAATQVDTSNIHFNMKENQQKAALRGLYNLQLSYTHQESGFGIKGGYTGSFGEGYGALFNNVASFNIGGKIWYGTYGNGANGYALSGAGGYRHKGADGKIKDTNIMIGYVGLSYSGVNKLKLGLDYAYVGGDNNYKLLNKAQDNPKNKGKLNSTNTNMNATMHEVALTATYSFTDKLSFSALVGSTFGDLQIGKAQATIQYSF